MSSEKLNIGDFVWAKMKGYPHWPAKIVEPPSSAKVQKKKSFYFVYFYGSQNYAWIQDKNVIPHSDSVFDSLTKKRSNAYQQAIDEFTSQLKASDGKKEKPEIKKKLSSKRKDTDNESVENGSNSKSSKFDADDDSTEPKITPSKPKVGKKKVYKKRLSVSTSAEEKGVSLKTAVDDNEESDSTDDSIEPYMHSQIIIKKRKVLHKKKRISNGSTEKERSKFEGGDDDSVSSKSNEPLKVSPKRKKSVDMDFNVKTGTSFSLSLPIIPDTFDESSNSSWGTAKIDESGIELQLADGDSDGVESTKESKSIGFLGLDLNGMGHFIVKRFLNSNFDVTLWKKEVSDENKYKGAKMANSPAEMVSLCDVVFAYYSDSKILNDNLYGPEGIVKGFEKVYQTNHLDSEEGKGFEEVPTSHSDRDVLKKSLDSEVTVKAFKRMKTNFQENVETSQKGEEDQGPKGFVLLTAVDKQTAFEINKKITAKKGLYLEAPICGTIEEAKSGKLSILASGDMKLFNDCKKFLIVITKICKFLKYKRIGFLGVDLDSMGHFIVRKFLNSNFDVTLWKTEVSDENKYKEAKMADSPAQMVTLCDVVFAYYSDRNLLKKNLKSKAGVFKGFEEAENLSQGPKGFVILTAVDKKKSLKINDVISVNKGLYLEAPICGTIEEAKSGKLIILASGDVKLFNECKKYLSVITKVCKFLIYKNKNPESSICSSSAENADCSSITENVNYSSKYNIIINMLNAGITASVSEAAKLTRKLGIPQKDMMNVMDAALKCNFGVMEKLESINNHSWNNVHTPLKHAQKDLDFCLQIADSVLHPMPVASATNEVYKQAKLLKYSDSDVTAVYNILKF